MEQQLLQTTEYKKISIKEIEDFIVNMCKKMIVYQKATGSKILEEQDKTYHAICWKKHYYSNDLKKIYDQIFSEHYEKNILKRIFDFNFFSSRHYKFFVNTIDNLVQEGTLIYNTLYLEKYLLVSEFISKNLSIPNNFLENLEKEIIDFYNSDEYKNLLKIKEEKTNES